MSTILLRFLAESGREVIFWAALVLTYGLYRLVEWLWRRRAERSQDEH